MNNNFLKTSFAPLSVEVVHQPRKIVNDGLKVNISELNQLIYLLDLPVEEIRQRFIIDDSFPMNNYTRNMVNQNNIMDNYSDAAKVTQDLDHLLSSLSQYKLNETTNSNFHEDNDRDSTSNYLYSEQLTNTKDFKNNSINSIIQDSTSPISSFNNAGSMIPVCVKCEEPIFDNSLSALSGYWHQYHFTCKGCDMNLESQIYYVDNDDPYCEACHISLFTNKCSYCGEPILDSSLTALDQYWHPEHFFCSSCEGPFDDNIGFHEQQGKPFCSECYFELFGQRCGGCHNPITTSFLTALGKKWHNECFVCKDCRSPFESINFRDIKGEPYCELHYHIKMGTICGACNKPIIGSLVSALGKKYHVDCFTCSYCLKKLAKGSFKENKNKPYCTECFSKLCP